MARVLVPTVATAILSENGAVTTQRQKTGGLIPASHRSTIRNTNDYSTLYTLSATGLVAVFLYQPFTVSSVVEASLANSTKLG